MIDLSLLEDFISGAGESLDEMETALLELEISPNNNELLHTIFRAMHTIKGAAQFVGLEKVAALSHVLEDLLDLLREGKKNITPELIELLIQTKDRISLLVIDLEKTKTELTEVDDLIAKIKTHFVEDSEQTTPEEPEEIDLAAFLAEDTPSLSVDDEDQAELELSAFLSEDEEDSVASVSNQSVLTEETIDEVALFDAREDDGIIIPNEEHDQELFSIYIQQLREKTAVLDDIAARLDWTVNKSPLFSTAIEAVESLKFSANYMGYEQLTRFYSRWLEELLDAQETATTSSQASFAFMASYLARLRHIFPQLPAGLPVSQESVKKQI